MNSGGNPLDGVIVANKPIRCTSHDIVMIARRRLEQKKIGHLGTLDPLATGCLPLCVGKATRLNTWLSRGRKIYTGTFVLGLETDTHDISGKTLRTCAEVDVREDRLLEAAAALVGRLNQVPPMYSAKKAGGTPLYRLARQGRVLERKPVPVEVYRFDITAIRGKQVDFEVDCGPGTYVRSLVHDLGTSLEVGAALSALSRLQSGAFTLEQAVCLASASRDALASAMIPLKELLPELPGCTLEGKQVWMVRNGQDIQVPDAIRCEEGGEVRLVSKDDDLVGLGQVVRTEPGHPCTVHPKVVLC